MIKKRELSYNFQTFFVSKEKCISPMIIDILNLCKKINETRLQKLDYDISLSYGKRLLINSRDIEFSNIKQQDIIEIVNYDPIKNIVLVIGEKYPSNKTPVHWIIQNARRDINAVVNISNKKLYEICSSQFPIIGNINNYNLIEKAKSILKALQKSKIICIKEKEILFVGLQLKDIENKVMKLFEDLK